MTNIKERTRFFLFLAGVQVFSFGANYWLFNRDFASVQASGSTSLSQSGMPVDQVATMISSISQLRSNVTWFMLNFVLLMIFTNFMALIYLNRNKPDRTNVITK